MIATPRTFLFGTAFASLLALTACGDTNAPAETSPTTADADGAGAAAADCSASGGATVNVDIGDFAFEPATVKVAACDEVTWTNTHTQPHTSTGTGDQQWSTDNVQPGDTAAGVLFETPGTYTYICALHPFMKGTVEVS